MGVEKMDRRLLRIICCPNCQGDLGQENENLVCQNCKAKFRQKEGILILITKELEEELRS